MLKNKSKRNSKYNKNTKRKTRKTRKLNGGKLTLENPDINNNVKKMKTTHINNITPPANISPSNSPINGSPLERIMDLLDTTGEHRQRRRQLNQ